MLAHNYFSIDAEEIYRLCSNEIEPFKNAIEQLRSNSF
ncbi:HepT-like ribonuclease domain-containing protein [Pseudanabaena sp. lw0831]|nr:HepT-like ribonuclease domain-containing protein [Pseudanabaena sp. lw0831]